MKTTLVLAVAALVLQGCASAPVGPRRLLKASFTQVMQRAPLAGGGPLVWLTNQEDSECNGAAPVVSAPHPLDGLAYEVFADLIATRQWGRLLEAHRHNYARDFKPETHRVVEAPGDGKPLRLTSSAEDLCLLDEAKKRNADKVLVYAVVGADASALVLHFRLSDARTGVVELARTLRATSQGVEDWSE